MQHRGKVSRVVCSECCASLRARNTESRWFLLHPAAKSRQWVGQQTRSKPMPICLRLRKRWNTTLLRIRRQYALTRHAVPSLPTFLVLLRSTEFRRARSFHPEWSSHFLRHGAQEELFRGRRTQLRLLSG